MRKCRRVWLRKRQNRTGTDNSAEEWMEYFHDRDIGYLGRRWVTNKSFDNFLTQRPSLYEHLLFQLNLICKNPDDLTVGQYIIGNIDPHGYLCVDADGNRRPNRG